MINCIRFWKIEILITLEEVVKIPSQIYINKQLFTVCVIINPVLAISIVIYFVLCLRSKKVKFKL